MLPHCLPHPPAEDCLAPPLRVAGKVCFAANPIQAAVPFCVAIPMRSIPARLLRRGPGKRGGCPVRVLLAEDQPQGCPVLSDCGPWQGEFAQLAAEAAPGAPLMVAATPCGTRGLAATQPLPPSSLLLSGEPLHCSVCEPTCLAEPSRTSACS